MFEGSVSSAVHASATELAAAPTVSAARTPRPTWDEIDRRLRDLAARRAGLDLEEARWLLVARREALHRHLGFATLEEYMERVLGYGPHAAAERLRTAQALVELPAIRAALGAGSLPYSAVRELTRVATASTEESWLAAAAGKSLRELEPMVAGRRKGDLPGTPAQPGERRARISFELSGETLALLRDARNALSDATGERLGDDALIATVCRLALAALADDGGATGARAPASYQVALTVCERCDRGWQDGAGVPVEVAADVVERARCDAQHVGRIDAAVPERATQDVPPAVRRLVWRRDHGRCVVPGCRASRYLELHHIQPRSHGGDHTADNLCLACFAHHQAAHAGRLVIGGTPSTGLTFAHADGRPYGTPPRSLAAGGDGPAPALIEQAEQVVRSTGYAASAARAAVAAAASHVGPGATLEDVVRAAFRQLHIAATS